MVLYIPDLMPGVLFCRYGVDNQTGRGRFVIEPPEVGAALAGITLSSGVAAAGSQMSATVNVASTKDDDVSVSQRERGVVDGVDVHASDGELSPSSGARRSRSRSDSSGSSSSSSGGSRAGRESDRRVASAAAGMDDMRAAVASAASPMEAAVERRESPRQRAREDEGARSRSVDQDELDRNNDQRLVIYGNEALPAKKRKRDVRGRGKGRRNKKSQHEIVGTHESERLIQRNLARSPHYGDYVPMFCPPPPYPGHEPRGRYVPAAAAGSSNDRARDVHFLEADDWRRERHQGADRERSRERGRSVARQPRLIHTRSPADDEGRSRGRSVPRRQESERARSRRRSLGPRVRQDDSQQGINYRSRRRSRSRSRR